VTCPAMSFGYGPDAPLTHSNPLSKFDPYLPYLRTPHPVGVNHLHQRARSTYAVRPFNIHITPPNTYFWLSICASTAFSCTHSRDMSPTNSASPGALSCRVHTITTHVAERACACRLRGCFAPYSTNTRVLQFRHRQRIRAYERQHLNLLVIGCRSSVAAAQPVTECTQATEERCQT